MGNAGAPNGDCYDVDYNIKTGAEYLLGQLKTYEYVLAASFLSGGSTDVASQRQHPARSRYVSQAV